MNENPNPPTPVSAVLVRDIAGYNLSRDYPLLSRLMRHVSVVCICDYGATGRYRDIAKSKYERLPGGEECYEIVARGIGYVLANRLEDFIAQCGQNQLEFIVPTRMPSPAIDPAKLIRGEVWRCGRGRCKWQGGETEVIYVPLRDRSTIGSCPWCGGNSFFVDRSKQDAAAVQNTEGTVQA